MKTDGGPAFPSTGEGFNNPLYSAPGMSLRDWFAGHASEEDVKRHRRYATTPMGKRWLDTVEEAKYRYADAMLAEREARDEQD